MRELIWGETLRFRLIRCSFFIIWVITIFVSARTYTATSRETLEATKSLLRHHVKNISYRYQLAYEEIISIVLNCMERKTFNLGGARRGLTPGAGKKGLDHTELIKDYCVISECEDYIVKLSVLDDRGGTVRTSSSFGSTDDAEGILDGGRLDRELDKTMDSYELDLIDFPFFQYEGQVLPIVRALTGSRSVPGGWVALCLSMDLFQDVPKDISGGQKAVVVTNEGKLIASLYEPKDHREENDRVARQLQQPGRNKGPLEMKIHGRNSLITFGQYSRSSIAAYETTTLDSFNNDKSTITQTVITVSTACLIFGFILSVLITNQIRKSIDRLVRHIGHVAAGNFTRGPDIEGEGEIDTVSKVVGDMSERIDTLMVERLEHEKEKGDLELKMFQAQINLHSLYNTLDSIWQIAVIQKNNGIVKMVTALSGLFKNMAKGLNKKVTLQEELDLPGDYATIEKVKYVELFDLEVRADGPRLYRALVIKFTLQPSVENAIFNGIEPGGKHGTALIHAYKEGNVFTVKARDSGMEIAREKMASILNHMEKIKDSPMNEIDLPNVDRRIKLDYGEEYGLTIEGQEGELIEITIKTSLEYEYEDESRQNG